MSDATLMIVVLVFFAGLIGFVLYMNHVKRKNQKLAIQNGIPTVGRVVETSLIRLSTVGQYHVNNFKNQHRTGRDFISVNDFENLDDDWFRSEVTLTVQYHSPFTGQPMTKTYLHNWKENAYSDTLIRYSLPVNLNTEAYDSPSSVWIEPMDQELVRVYVMQDEKDSSKEHIALDFEEPVDMEQSS